MLHTHIHYTYPCPYTPHHIYRPSKTAEPGSGVLLGDQIPQGGFTKWKVEAHPHYKLKREKKQEFRVGKNIVAGKEEEEKGQF